jgi:TonB family protein
MLVFASVLFMANAQSAAPPAAPPAGGLIQRPELINGAQPDYPETLLGSGISGRCVVLIDIDDEGLVQQITVKSCSDLAFSRAAFAVMAHYTFIPGATAQGSVPVRITWEAEFRHPEAPKKLVVKPKPVRISGRLREGGSGVVIGGADVACKGQAASALSDDQGRFELRGLADGPCLLLLRAAGYHALDKNIVLAANESVELTLYLAPTAASAMRTVLRGRKEEEHMTRRILDVEEMGRVPGTMGDPIRAVERLPGVARMPFVGGGGLVVRGAEPQDSGYYIDGAPVPFLFHLGGGPSVIHPDFVAQLDFLPGGFGARYGRATAGVVDVRSRAAKGDRFSGKIDVDLMDAGLRLEGPVPGYKNWAYGLSGRRSYIDVLLPIATRAVGANDVSIQPIYWDYQARLDYKKGSDRLGLRVYGADDVLVISAADEESQARAGGPPGIGIHTQFHRFIIDGRRKLSKKTEIFGNILLGRTSSGGTVGDTIFWDLGISELGLRLDLVHSFSKELRLTSGLDIGASGFSTQSEFPSLGTIERSFPARSFAEDPQLRRVEEEVFGRAFGVHSTLRIKPFKRLTLLPGLRLDSYHWASQDRFSLEPRLQARLSLARKDRHLLKLSGGKYSKTPEPPELSDAIGNPELKLKGAWQYGLGYEYRPDPFFHVDVTLFYKNMFHLIGRNPDYQAGSTQPLLLNNVDGRAYGMELMLRHRVSPRPLYGWIAYTLSRSERFNRGEPQPEWTVFDLDQTHILSSVVGYKWGKGWSFGVTNRWVTGNPTTERVGARFDADLQSYRPVFGDENGSRMPAFFQMDMRLERKSALKRNSYTWFVDVMNVTNHQNLEFTIYQYDQRAYSGIAGVPFFPSFGLEWSW